MLNGIFLLKTNWFMTLFQWVSESVIWSPIEVRSCPRTLSGQLKKHWVYMLSSVIRDEHWRVDSGKDFCIISQSSCNNLLVDGITSFASIISQVASSISWTWPGKKVPCVSRGEALLGEESIKYQTPVFGRFISCKAARARASIYLPLYFLPI